MGLAGVISSGQATYRTADGRDNDGFIGGFSQRERNLSLRLASSCDRHVDRLGDIDLDVLRELITTSPDLVIDDWSLGPRPVEAAPVTGYEMS